MEINLLTLELFKMTKLNFKDFIKKNKKFKKLYYERVTATENL